MSPFLSIAWLGFDRDLDSLRATIVDLNAMAADLGETIGEMAGRPDANADVGRRLKSLRTHRFWLMEQAERLAQKLAHAEGRSTERDIIENAVAALGCDVRWAL